MHKNLNVYNGIIYNCLRLEAFSESEVAQSCPTLSNLMDCSLPGSSIHGIFQARVLEWGAIEDIQFSRSVVFDSLRPHGLQPTRLLCPWDFPGKSSGVGCHCLLRYKSIHGCYFNNDKIYNKMLNLIPAVVF